jgi:hypothetical protein
MNLTNQEIENLNFKIPKYLPFSIYNNKNGTFSDIFNSNDYSTSTNKLSLLEKEKEINNQLKTRYELQLEINNKNQKKIKDLESLLHNEKLNCQNLNQDLNNIILSEKEKNNILEQKFFLMKEEYTKIKLQLDKISTNYEIKYQDLYLNINKLTLENETLIEEINLLKFSLESEKKCSENNLKSIKNILTQNFEKEFITNYESIIKEKENEKKKMISEWDLKLESMKQDLKNSNIKYDLVNYDLSKIKKELHDTKLSYDNEIIFIQNKITNEEVILYNIIF